MFRCSDARAIRGTVHWSTMTTSSREAPAYSTADAVMPCGNLLAATASISIETRTAMKIAARTIRARGRGIRSLATQ